MFFSSFFEMQLYSDNLSTIATIPSLIMLELFPTCFSCDNNFNLSHNSLRFSGKNIVETPEALITGDSSNFLRDLPLVLVVLFAEYQSSFLFQTHKIFFYPVD